LLSQAEAVETVRVCYGPSYETAARYMAAWIGGALPRAKTVAERAADTPTLRVDLSGPRLTVELARRGDTLLVTVNGKSHHTNLTQPTDYLLMREELGVVGRDPVFERALAAAALTYPTVK
jgi:hypothetical protein